MTLVLLAMALLKNLTILFYDISVAFMNTPMPDWDPVYVEPLEGLYENNDMVWCLNVALNGLKDASRLFHEHLADVLTSQLGFARSEAQPTLFVDLARNVFIAELVDDLIMVGSSSQLYDVVGDTKPLFTMNVTPPLSHSDNAAQHSTCTHGGTGDPGHKVARSAVLFKRGSRLPCSAVFAPVLPCGRSARTDGRSRYDAGLTLTAASISPGGTSCSCGASWTAETASSLWSTFSRGARTSGTLLDVVVLCDSCKAFVSVGGRFGV